MPEGLAFGLQWGGYALELVLLIILLSRGYLHSLRSLCVFVGTLLAVDAGVRPLSLFLYGVRSNAYYDLYWVTDLVLVLASFALICAFFRRACLQHHEIWKLVRPALVIVFVLELGISSATFLRQYHNNLLATRFMYGFSQDLYFTCVVLTTALYLMLEWFKSRDHLLHLLVCGLGIQYAGPAANTALYLITSNSDARHLLAYLLPVCNAAMLAIWVYAVARQPRSAVGRLRVAA